MNSVISTVEEEVPLVMPQNRDHPLLQDAGAHPAASAASGGVARDKSGLSFNTPIETLFERHTFQEVDTFLVTTASKASHIAEEIRILVGSHSPAILNASQLLHSMLQSSEALHGMTTAYAGHLQHLRATFESNKPKSVRVATTPSFNIQTAPAATFGEATQEDPAALSSRLSDLYEQLASLHCFRNALPIQRHYLSLLRTTALRIRNPKDTPLFYRLLTVLVIYTLISLPSEVKSIMMKHDFLETLQLVYVEVLHLLRMLNFLLESKRANLIEVLSTLLSESPETSVLFESNIASGTDTVEVGLNASLHPINGVERVEAEALDFPFNVEEIMGHTVAQLSHLPLQICAFSQRCLSNAHLETDKLLSALSTLLVLQVPFHFTIHQFVLYYYSAREEVLWKLLNTLTPFAGRKDKQFDAITEDTSSFASTVLNFSHTTSSSHAPIDSLNAFASAFVERFVLLLFVYESTLLVAYHTFLPKQHEDATYFFEAVRQLESKASIFSKSSRWQFTRQHWNTVQTFTGFRFHAAYAPMFFPASIVDLQTALDTLSEERSDSSPSLLQEVSIKFYSTYADSIISHAHKIMHSPSCPLTCSSLRDVWKQITDKISDHRNGRLLLNSTWKKDSSYWETDWKDMCHRLCKTEPVDLLSRLQSVVYAYSYAAVKNMVKRVDFSIDPAEVTSLGAAFTNVLISPMGSKSGEAPKDVSLWTFSNEWLQKLDDEFKYFMEELGAINEFMLLSVTPTNKVPRVANDSQSIHLLEFLNAFLDHIELKLKCVLDSNSLVQILKQQNAFGQTMTTDADAIQASAFYIWLLIGHRLECVLESYHINDDHTLNIFNSTSTPHISQFFRKCYTHHQCEIKDQLVSILMKIEETVDCCYKLFVHRYLSEKLQLCKIELKEFLEQPIDSFNSVNRRFGVESVTVSSDIVPAKANEQALKLWIPGNATASIDSLLMFTCEFISVLTAASRLSKFPTRLLHITKLMLSEELALIYDTILQAFLDEQKNRDVALGGNSFVSRFFQVLFNLSYAAIILDSSCLSLRSPNNVLQDTEAELPSSPYSERASVTSALESVLQKYEVNFLVQKSDQLLYLSLIREYTFKAVFKTFLLYTILLKDNPSYKYIYSSSVNALDQSVPPVVGLRPVHPEFRLLPFPLPSGTSKLNYPSISNAASRMNASNAGIPLQLDFSTSSFNKYKPTNLEFSKNLKKDSASDRGIGGREANKSKNNNSADRGNVTLAKNLHSWLSTDPSNINVSVADLSKQVENVGAFLGRHVESMQTRVTDVIRKRNE